MIYRDWKCWLEKRKGGGKGGGGLKMGDGVLKRGVAMRCCVVFALGVGVRRGICGTPAQGGQIFCLADYFRDTR